MDEGEGKDHRLVCQETEAGGVVIGREEGGTRGQYKAVQADVKDPTISSGVISL